MRQHLTASNPTLLRYQQGQADVYSITRAKTRAKVEALVAPKGGRLLRNAAGGPFFFSPKEVRSITTQVRQPLKAVLVQADNRLRQPATALSRLWRRRRSA